MVRVTAYTGGRTVPSARFRVRQYIPELKRFGIEVRESPARFGSYPPVSRTLRLSWGIMTLAERFGAALSARDGHVTLLQREMLSTFATAERFTKAPRVLDVDDAIWLYRGGRFAASIARLCDTVICGNAFIADFFQKHAENVAVLPTAVDTDRFRPSETRKTSGVRVICWSGTSSGFRFLQAIEKALATVLRRDANRRLRIVSDARPRFESIPDESVEFVPWSEGVEVEAIQSADVAIMPLDDSPWSRGKCGYKLLTYMSCGIPVVATPAGMNRELLAKARAGVPAKTAREWVDGIEYLLNAEAPALGSAGRDLVIREFSVRALAPKLGSILRVAAERN